MNLEQSINDDFVESFKDETNLGGIFFKLILAGVDSGNPHLIPMGLDINEPRVKAIIDRALAQREAQPCPVGRREQG